MTDKIWNWLWNISNCENLSIKEWMSVRLVNPRSVRQVWRLIGVFVVRTVTVELFSVRIIWLSVESINEMSVGHGPPQWRSVEGKNWWLIARMMRSQSQELHCSDLGLAEDSELRSVVEEDRAREARSVWDAARDREVIGLEEVGGKVEAAEEPPDLSCPPPPPYQPLTLLVLRHESGLCRAARLDWVGLIIRKLSYSMFLSYIYIYLAGNDA